MLEPEIVPEVIAPGADASHTFATSNTSTSTSYAMTKSVDLESILAQRNAYVTALRAAAEASQKAAALGDMRLELQAIGQRRGYYHWPEEKCVDEMIARHDSALWYRLLKDSGLYVFLDATARASWKEKLDNNDFPEINAENLRATFAMLYDERNEMFERGVIALFQKLSWDYKTNTGHGGTPRLLGKRVIIENACEWVHGIAHAFCNLLDDIFRIAFVIEGKPVPEHDQGAWHTIRKHPAGAWPSQHNNLVLHDFVSLRGFKNRNVHMTFLRPDLVNAMNRIIAKHYKNALPPADVD